MLYLLYSEIVNIIVNRLSHSAASSREGCMTTPRNITEDFTARYLVSVTAE